MNKKIIYLAMGGILHDVGKILHRYNDGRNHSISGEECLRNRCSNIPKEVLVQVKYHHANLLKRANLDDMSLAYITYIADNIASMADRRSKNEEGFGFSRELPLDSIFNILNGNNDEYHYPPSDLSKEEIVFPTDKEIKYTETFYGRCIDNIINAVNGIDLDTEFINSLLEVAEANMSYIPSSTSIKEIADISLYDHSKITAALACCIYLYLEEIQCESYKIRLFKETKEFYKENAFILYSMDISGIQEFIYTIQSKDALKNLRSRSFYLELVMEHLVDELLEKLELYRTNLIYAGGGHAYILLPNTKKCKEIIRQHEKVTNDWLMKHFETALYLSGGYNECSANDFYNNPEGSYARIFKEISNQISKNKLRRYTASEIVALNNKDEADGIRECKVCHSSAKLSNDLCPMCSGLKEMSKLIQNKEFFIVVSEYTQDSILELPGGRYLEVDSKDELKKKMKCDNYIRAYCKNKMYTGLGVSSKIWIGDYQNGKDFRELANNSYGIKRLGVLRADIDNLGQAFVQGFDSKFVSLSRTATFSRKLSSFFKEKINYILANGNYYLHDDELESSKRNATIVYSGGDDVFIVGAWDDVIGLAVDIRDALLEYSQDTLTISGGIGIYPEKYPVTAMARQTGDLEDVSKSLEGKDAITLFDESLSFHWEEFVEEVIEDKYRIVYEFFENSKLEANYGKAFIYKLVDYMRNRDEKINLARFAYLLTRMEPKDTEGIEKYREFSKKMYLWMKDDKMCRQAIMALYLYVYMTREKEECDK